MIYSYRRPSLRLISWIGLALTYSVAWTQNLDVRPKFIPGSSYRYRLAAELDVAGALSTYDALTLYRVTKVDADGVYSLEISTIPGGKARLSGADLDAPAPAPETQTRSSTGELRDITGPMVPLDTFRVANLLTLFVPPHPVLAGDSWSHDFPVSPKNLVPIHADYKFVGSVKVAMERAGDVDANLVTIEAKETSGQDAASVSVQIWLDPKDSTVLKIESRWHNAPFPGRSGNVSGKVTMMRQPMVPEDQPGIRTKNPSDGVLVPPPVPPSVLPTTPSPTKPVTPPAAGLIIFCSTNQDDGVVFMGRLSVDGAVGMAGRRPAFHTDGP